MAAHCGFSMRLIGPTGRAGDSGVFRCPLWQRKAGWVANADGAQHPCGEDASWFELSAMEGRGWRAAHSPKGTVGSGNRAFGLHKKPRQGRRICGHAQGLLVATPTSVFRSLSLKGSSHQEGQTAINGSGARK